MKKRLLALLFLIVVVAGFLFWNTPRSSEEFEINRLGGHAMVHANSSKLSAVGEWLENRTGWSFTSEAYNVVHFYHDTLTDDGLTSLRLLGVKDLRLECPRLTIRSARHLATLSELESLYIATANVDDEWIVEIAKLKRLEMLNVMNSQVSDRSAAAIKSLPNLKYLAVANSRMTNLALLEVVDAPALKSLSIDPDQWSQELHAKCRSTTPWRAQLVDLNIHRE